MKEVHEDNLDKMAWWAICLVCVGPLVPYAL